MLTSKNADRVGLFAEAAIQGRLAIQQGDAWFALTPLSGAPVPIEAPQVEEREPLRQEPQDEPIDLEEQQKKLVVLRRDTVIALKQRALDEFAHTGKYVTDSDIVERAIWRYFDAHPAPEGERGPDAIPESREEMTVICRVPRDLGKRTKRFRYEYGISEQAVISHAIESYFEERDDVEIARSLKA